MRLRRADVLIVGLTISAIGVAMWAAYSVIGVSQLWGVTIAAAGSAIAFLHLFVRDPGPPLSDDEVARKRAAAKLREIAQWVEDTTQQVFGPEFQQQFLRRWNHVERSALANQLEARFGIGVRDGLLTQPISNSEAQRFISALRQAADDV